MVSKGYLLEFHGNQNENIYRISEKTEKLQGHIVEDTHTSQFHMSAQETVHHQQLGRRDWAPKEVGPHT